MDRYDVGRKLGELMPVVAPTADRQGALTRAREAVYVLREVTRILAEPAEGADRVESAMRIVNTVFPLVAKKRGGVAVETDGRAWMELVDAVEHAADQVTDGLPIKYADPAMWAGRWPEYAAKLTRATFHRAVEASRAVRAAAEATGRRKGRVPAKWPVYFKMLTEAGLAGNVKNAENLARRWKHSREG
jgi:hypothetical protein